MEEAKQQVFVLLRKGASARGPSVFSEVPRRSGMVARSESMNRGSLVVGRKTVIIRLCGRFMKE